MIPMRLSKPQKRSNLYLRAAQIIRPGHHAVASFVGETILIIAAREPTTTIRMILFIMPAFFCKSYP